MYKYKVVEKKKKSFLRGAMKPSKLEDLINKYANKGWVLDRIVAGETARFMGLSDKDVFLLIFRKDSSG